MASLEEQLSEYSSQLSKLVPTKKEQEQANEAGAKVFAEKLTEITKSKHYSRKKDAKYGHMADNISFSATNSDGEHDGSASVGWINRYHAMNAMRLNNGTVNIHADHFVDQARNDCQKEVFEAQARAIKASRGRGDD